MAGADEKLKDNSFLYFHNTFEHLPCQGSRDAYWLFFKLVSRARMSEKILALIKFCLPVQNFVIIKIQSKTESYRNKSKWKGCILFSLCSSHFHFTNSTTRTKIDLLCIDSLRLLKEYFLIKL